ncbi:hypothetical protein SAMN04489724_0386 [Algoriphagus locisalis]|uniref:Uncharacterized protein n=1 Tax=Algoriphagus locisalis TaxID=305507 RepID=A0A1I7EAM5_9BACT|nr:hypothetical protein [Algoriphagus locisalis]SFU20913.1 hypothetical protein SAMN04489724_0386 [Algoriphagus locisalis]
MKREIKPLFRKVNTKARGVRHEFGGDFKNSRNKKGETREVTKGSMHGKVERGLDYTPLFRFLLSKVGLAWETVFREAESRLDKTDPIYWVVAINEEDKQDYVRVGESSYFSGMFVDENGILQLTDPALTAKDLTPFCTCCTHTLNGKVFGSE